MEEYNGFLFQVLVDQEQLENTSTAFFFFFFKKLRKVKICTNLSIIISCQHFLIFSLVILEVRDKTYAT